MTNTNTAPEFTSHYRCCLCHTIETYNTFTKLTMVWTKSTCHRCTIATRWYRRTDAQVRAALGYVPTGML